jgi:hypothetical protein
MSTPHEQLQAMRDLRENWDGYGAAAPQGRAIDLAQEFAGLIEALRQKTSADPGMLQVSPTRVGGVLIEWEDAAQQHEVDINPDGSVGFLHLNKTTGQVATRMFSPETTAVVSQGVVKASPVILLSKIGLADLLGQVGLPVVSPTAAVVEV